MSKQHLENQTEKAVRIFADNLCDFMGWDKIDIARFKVGNMSQYRGYCMVDSKDNIYILISNNPETYPNGFTEKHFWNVVVHEMIHAYLYKNGYALDKSFGHGKAFKNIAKQIADKTDFTYKGLTR